ncbi:MAG: hypothetical protein VX304_05915, partial [Planctomycetota bacterium]|nr:hypothetical protein [Planctomycetota bacterium]
PIDDHQLGSGLPGRSRQPGRRMDDERRTHRQKQVTGFSQPRAPTKRVGIQHLSKRNCRVFERPLAFWAKRRDTGFEEFVDPVVRTVSPRTIQAHNIPGGSVDFQNIAASGILVQSIDILCDHTIQNSIGLPSCQHLVADIGSGFGIFFVCLALMSPVFKSRCFTRHKVVEKNWIRVFPDTAWRTKIGNAAFGAYAGASEGNG